ncbi:hypothetical protein [Spiroplasma sp. AdecLV25b]|uniref:hypothetical protein n=1 Tax=Spiroplasma sp. AdecLV25b TaxID=3027162 RepID=UPI0027E008F8|nr:hypothetical protein [Spiroplasma sp. AdecLV25b]
MFYLSIIYRWLLMKFILNNKQTFNNVNEIKSHLKISVFYRWKTIRKSSYFSNETKSFFKISFISWMINMIISAIISILTIFIVTLNFAYWIGLFEENLFLAWKIQLTIIILNLIFIIRTNSDYVKTSLRGSLVNIISRKLLIIDFLTLNILGIISVFKSKNIIDLFDVYQIKYNHLGIITFYKRIKWMILGYVFILLLLLLITIIMGILAKSLNYFFWNMFLFFSVLPLSLVL